jgi:hypothetical protein
MSRYTTGPNITCGNGILAALEARGPLSTDALCEHAGRAASLPESVFVSAAWKSRVYRRAVELEGNGIIASVKVYNGKAYERVWSMRKKYSKPVDNV